MAANPVAWRVPGGSTIKAALPPKPTRQYSFTDNSTNNPTSQQPGNRMDAEYDRTNQSVSGLIDFCGATFNTDGTLRPGTVGMAQLDPDIVGDITADIEADVQPLVDQAKGAAVTATNSANSATSSANLAALNAGNASTSAGSAQTAALAAGQSQVAAAASQTAAGNSASAAANSANHADGDAVLCEEYSVVSQAWAEHMPDTIPPNILAVMNITGDHWSSRWWANRAHEMVIDDTQEAICQIEAFWLGSYSSPPTHDSCGNPVAQGAMYYNLTSGTTQVYDGNYWQPVVQPVPGNLNEYLYLPTGPQSTFSGPDFHSNNLTFGANGETGVYLNGVRQLEGIDYSVGSAPDSISFLHGSINPPSTVEIIVTAVIPATAPPVPAAIKVNTNAWNFNGVTTAFPLHDAQGNSLTPSSDSDCMVSLNGVIQEPTRDYTTTTGVITFTSPPQADADKWMLVGLPIQTATSRVDTSTWVFDGVTKIFPLKDQLGTIITPPTPNACIVSLNGVIQEPGGDYTTQPGEIDFATAPESDADKWMVVSTMVVSAATATSTSTYQPLVMQRDCAELMAPLVARIDALEAQLAQRGRQR